MRRIEAAVLLAFLASCAVKTTSDALCHKDENCPADERCQLAGSDAGRCVACVSDRSCTGPDVFSCAADGKKLVCQQNAGTCWYRVEQPCASGLACGTPGGVSQCVCAESPDATFYVDPEQGSDGGSAPYPTGVASPPQCRYRTLTKALSQALAAATAQALSGQSAAAKVIAMGSTGSGTPLVFASPDETFPLEVGSGVSLSTADAQSGAAPSGAYVVAFDAAAGPALKLDPGSSVSGWLLQNVSSEPGVGPVLSVACSAGAQFTLDGVSIEGASEGGFTAGRGIDLDGACTANLTAVTIEHTSSDGVVVTGGAQLDATALNVSTANGGGGSGGGGGGSGGNGVTVIGPSSSLALHGGRIDKNGKAGIEVLSGGGLSVDQGTSVSSNGTSGISIQASSATLTGTADQMITVAKNLGTGVLVCEGVTAGCGNDASVTAQAKFLEVDQNGDGMVIDNEAGAVIGVSSSNFHDNVGVGLRVDRSGQPVQGVNSTLVDHCEFKGGTNGISLTGTGSGITWVTVQGSQLSGASDTAFVAKLPGAGYSGVTLLDNTIAGNGVGTGSQAPILRGTAKRPVGGVFFTSGVPSLVFQHNTLMNNTGDQLFVSSSDNSKPWRFDNPSDCSQANVFACYASGQGVIAEGKANVYVGSAQWPGDPPSQGTDYMTFGSASISLSSPATPNAISVCGVTDVSCN